MTPRKKLYKVLEGYALIYGKDATYGPGTVVDQVPLGQHWKVEEFVPPEGWGGNIQPIGQYQNGAGQDRKTFLANAEQRVSAELAGLEAAKTAQDKRDRELAAATEEHKIRAAELIGQQAALDERLKKVNELSDAVIARSKALEHTARELESKADDLKATAKLQSDIDEEQGKRQKELDERAAELSELQTELDEREKAAVATAEVKEVATPDNDPDNKSA